MTDLAAAFPKRPLKLRKTGVLPGIFSYLGGLLLLVIAGIIAVWQVPSILDDWTIAQNPVVVDDSVISDGNCTVRRFVFVECEADVTYTVKSKTFERKIDLLFVDVGTHDYEVDVVRSGDIPQLVTLSLGIEKLWNRIGVVGGLIALLAVGGIALFLAGGRSDRTRRLGRQALPVTPVPVTITNATKVWGGKKFVYSAPRPGKKRGIAGTARLGKKQEPFWLAPETGVALAVIQQGGTMPVLLDAELTLLDLTPAERYQITASVAPNPTAAA